MGQTLTWSGNLVLHNAATFVNEGTLVLTNDSSMSSSDADSTFHNTSTGTLIKSGGSGDQSLFYGSRFAVGHVINDGTIQVDVGTVGLGYQPSVFENNGSIIARAAVGQPKTTVWLLNDVTSSGSIDADRVRFHAGSNTSIAAITGSYQASSTDVNLGTVRISGTILELGPLSIGTFGGGPLDLTGATFAPGAATLPSLTLGGTLITDRDLSVAGSFTWNGGTLQGVNGQGSLTVLSDTTLNGTYYVRDFHLINAGDAVWTGGTVQFYGDSVLVHQCRRGDVRNPGRRHLRQLRQPLHPLQ